LKKFFPYIIVGLAVVAVLVLFFTSENKVNRQFDGRVTLRAKDKIPYGAFIAFDNLDELFPEATIITSKEEPGYWDSLSNYDTGQALIIVSPNFNPDEDEMKKLIQFMEEGNDIFVSTMNVSYEATQMMKCDMNAAETLMYYFEQSEGSDLLSVSLARPPFVKKATYSYPGKRFDFYFYKLDSATVTVLGYDKTDKPNFIQLKAGKGNLFVHLAPMTFSNYFLLHRDNIAYYENVLSVISPRTAKVVWDEYFINKRQGPAKSPNWLTSFFKYKELKWALLVALLALLLYVLSEMRRKQRIIPLITKPRNESLEFVKTIGRLYHDKGDHKNLCRKMSAYFLEHVRNRYKLPTSELDEQFIKNLHGKTGVVEDEITDIVSFISNLDSLPVVSEKQLAVFHRQLESFYKKT